MHEFSLAQNILGIVREHVSPAEEQNVRTVRVQAGRLAGVVPASLQFCWQALVAESSLGQSSLEIEQLPLRIHCADCAEVFAVAEDSFLCPACGGGRTEVVSGMELLVAAIEVTEEAV